MLTQPNGRESSILVPVQVGGPIFHILGAIPKREPNKLRVYRHLGHVSFPSCYCVGSRLTCLSDFGDEFPSAEVIGTDISPIQPSWVPPNVKLYVLQGMPPFQTLPR